LLVFLCPNRRVALRPGGELERDAHNEQGGAPPGGPYRLKWWKGAG